MAGALFAVQNPPHPTHPHHPPTGSEPEYTAQRLAELGAETSKERTAKRLVPWIVSFGVHALLIALGFLLTWTVIQLQEDREPTLIVADFDALVYQPVASMEDELQQEKLKQDQEEIKPIDKLLSEQLAELEIDPLNAISDAASPPRAIDFAPDPSANAATFVGLRSSNAKRIVYVIDASGSMIRSLQIVIQELARSIERLSPQQSFGLIFFQEDKALMVPPTTRLVRATPDAKIKALKWIDDKVIPAGRSNPLKAIEKALSFEPDVIFLLSENITGIGEFEIPQEELLDLLDKLNPVNEKYHRRATLINCVQFLYPDPLNTLKKIAEQHGGENGYKFLTAQELGIAVP